MQAQDERFGKQVQNATQSIEAADLLAGQADENDESLRPEPSAKLWTRVAKVLAFEGLAIKSRNRCKFEIFISKTKAN